MGVGLSNRVDADRDRALAEERTYVARLYARLDELRERTAERRAEVLRQRPENPQRHLLREDVAARYTDDMARLAAVDNGLCFGRLDFNTGATMHIGRIGMVDEELGRLLVDWRADAARDFYLATAANPDGVTRRRQIRTRLREVVDVSDEILDLDAPRDDWREEVTGEAALLASLNAARDDRMHDIVATIQAEQDAIIRSPLDGVLVVSGGPGTGKTAVALHRAAYLLYQHREKLAGRGVLLLGPNATFLRYIGDVLPGLAETDVLLRTVGDLYPGIVADRREDPRAAAVKGSPSMVDVIAAALAERQRLPERAVDANTEYGLLVLDRATCAAARDKARASGKLHNAARAVHNAAIMDAFVDRVAQRIGADPLGGESLLDAADLAEVRRELLAETEVQAVLDWLWPELTPTQLVSWLLNSVRHIAAAAPHLTPEQRELLVRSPHSGWAESDVPLLDEAAELLGEADDTAARERERRRLASRLAYAQGVLDIVTGSRSIDLEDEDDPDPELLLATDVLDAQFLGERHVADAYLSTAERAAADRTWSFGHVVVDEAQELSPMAWRMVMRRCVTRSLTIVGDLAQTGALAGPATWGEILDPYAPGRWRREDLTVSYRTPAEIMDVAARTLSRVDPSLTAPRAVRSTGAIPWDATIDASELEAELRKHIDAEAEAIGSGSIGVIVPAGRVGAAAIHATGSVSVLTVRDAKGLEFDAVIVVDPEAVVAESPRGHSDLYVALTRATRRLGILRVAPETD